MEFVIPAGTRVVFVGDMFMSDYAGGAEATSEAIIKKCPFKIFKVHSSSLTVDMLERYPDKYWVIGNMVQCDIAALGYMIEKKLRYSVVEYDYKYCMYRSEVMHKKQSGADCDCPLRPVHAILVVVLHNGISQLLLDHVSKCGNVTLNHVSNNPIFVRISFEHVHSQRRRVNLENLEGTLLDNCLRGCFCTSGIVRHKHVTDENNTSPCWNNKFHRDSREVIICCCGA
jgi:hypothetical protein